jgi:hypothetical protein
VALLLAGCAPQIIKPPECEGGKQSAEMSIPVLAGTKGVRVTHNVLVTVEASCMPASEVQALVAAIAVMLTQP